MCLQRTRRGTTRCCEASAGTLWVLWRVGERWFSGAVGEDGGRSPVAVRSGVHLRVPGRKRREAVCLRPWSRPCRRRRACRAPRHLCRSSSQRCTRAPVSPAVAPDAGSGQPIVRARPASPPPSLWGRLPTGCAPVFFWLLAAAPGRPGARAAEGQPIGRTGRAPAALAAARGWRPVCLNALSQTGIPGRDIRRSRTVLSQMGCMCFEIGHNMGHKPN